MTHTDKMLREGSLAGKVIVVTGGGSGLGKAMTSYFLELGAKVAITSRKLEKLEAQPKNSVMQRVVTALLLLVTFEIMSKSNRCTNK